MPEILAAAGAEAALAPTVAAATIPEIAGAGALGSMTGGLELAGLTNAATPAVFNPATVGGLAQSMQLANGIGLPGLAGLNANVAGLPGLLQNVPVSVEEQLAQISANPTDFSKLPKYEDLASNTTDLVEKTSPYNYDPENALGNLDKTSADRIAAANKIMQGNSITGQSVWGDLKTLADKPNWANLKAFANENPKTALTLALAGMQLMKPKTPTVKTAPQYIRPYTNTRTTRANPNFYSPYSGGSTAERNYFTGGLEAQPIQRIAGGGLTGFAVGGPIETMSAMNAVGENLGYPQSQYQTDIYSNPNVQRPQAMNLIGSESDTNVDRYTGEEKFASGGDTSGYQYTYDPVTQQFTQLNDPVAEAKQQTLQPESWNSIGMRFQPQKVTPKPFTPVVTGGITTPAIQQAAQAPVQQTTQVAQAPAINVPAYQTPEQQLGLGGFYNYMNQQLAGMRDKGMAAGGLSHLGGYSDGGRLLRGPGDGVSDSIPASIGNRQPARLADGEFVVPARIVSELGNGSTEAGARKLYAMMDRVQHARRKSSGKNKVALNTKADKYLPA
jgi:hypothetical protein